MELTHEISDDVVHHIYKLVEMCAVSMYMNCYCAELNILNLLKLEWQVHPNTFLIQQVMFTAT